MAVGPSMVGLDTAGDLSAIEYYYWDGDSWELVVIGAIDDKYVKVSADDTVAGYLEAKTAQGTGITLSTVGGPGDEDLVIAHAADASAIPDSHHDRVTLAADAQELLNLSIQELGFVAQVANTVLAGPAAGGNADPTFRVLVAADIPTPSGGGGIVHYDYVVDPNYTGGEGDELTLSTESIAKVYTTIGLAIAAADAANADSSILVNEGSYAEAVVIPTTMTHKLWLVGEGFGKVTITGAAGIGISIPSVSAHDDLYFKNLHVGGGVASYSVSVTAFNAPVHFEDCEFTRKVGGDFASSSFDRCEFGGGYDIDNVVFTPAAVTFTDCIFAALSTWSAGSLDNHLFSNCTWTGQLATILVDGADVNRVTFSGCQHVTSIATTFFHVNNAASYVHGLTFDGHRFYHPAANGAIYVQSCQAGTVGPGIIISNCQFARLNASGNPFIKCDDADASGWVIQGNAFGEAADGYVEDAAGVSVTGVFIDAVIGPNSPPDFAIDLAANSARVIYVGTGLVTEAAVGMAIRSGMVYHKAGTPQGAVNGYEGDFCWDITNDNLYVNTDAAGGTNWDKINDGVGGAQDVNLLDGDEHNDTLASGVITRGSVIAANATPAWAELLPYQAGEYLRFDGTDAYWGLLTITDHDHTGDAGDGGSLDGTYATDAELAAHEGDDDAHHALATAADGGHVVMGQAIASQPATDAVIGHASFNTANFLVTAGDVTIKDKGVVYAEIQDVSATDKLLGRSTAGAGVVEEIACTAAGRALLDDADAAAQLVTLGAQATSEKAVANGYMGLDANQYGTDPPQAHGHTGAGSGGALYSVHQYVFCPDAGPGEDVETGAHQGPIHVSGPSTETVKRITAIAETAAGTAFTFTLDYDSGNDDFDTFVVDTEIDSVAMGTAKGVVVAAGFTTATITARSLISLDVTTVTGTAPKDVTIILEVWRPLQT